MSTGYYLHHVEFPESVSIGVSRGNQWATECGPWRNNRTAWTVTAELLAFLEEMSAKQRQLEYQPWIADEYGKILTLGEAAAMIRAHGVHHHYGHPAGWDGPD